MHALTDSVGMLVGGLLSGATLTEGLDEIGSFSTTRILFLLISLAVAAFVIRKSVIEKAIAAQKAEAA